MVRLNSNGVIDTSFGTNGKVTDSITLLQLSSMAVQNDGKILVLGGGNPSSFITKRYYSNGSLDNSYGVGGTSYTKIAGLNTYHGPHSLAIRPDGKIIVGGELSANNVSQSAILRYTSDG